MEQMLTDYQTLQTTNNITVVLDAPKAPKVEVDATVTTEGEVAQTGTTKDETFVELTSDEYNA